MSYGAGSALLMDEGELQTLLTYTARQDHGAFERLYQRVAPKLFGICRQMLRRDDQAEEALQETFVQIWRDARNFDPNRASALTWMAVIARHRCLDLIRRRRPETSLDEDESVAERADDGPTPLETVLQLSENSALKRCMDILTEQQRTSITLAFFRGLSHQELSELLAIPLGTVKSWVRRGLERLQRCLQS
ncbi:MAG: sigma-70 family RNA polymerase sigma factor [Gammaproteobacteria bacterium]